MAAIPDKNDPELKSFPEHDSILKSQDAPEAASRIIFRNSLNRFAAARSPDCVCEHCAKVNFDSVRLMNPFSFTKSVMHTTVGAVIANKDCPSCRLIAYHIAFFSDAYIIPEATEVSLWISKAFLTRKKEAGTCIVRAKQPIASKYISAPAHQMDRKWGESISLVHYFRSGKTNLAKFNVKCTLKRYFRALIMNPSSRLGCFKIQLMLDCSEPG